MNGVNWLHDRHEVAIERRREEACSIRLAEWKRMQFLENMNEMLHNFQLTMPDARLEFAGPRRATIIAQNPRTGEPTRWLFVP